MTSSGDMDELFCEQHSESDKSESLPSLLQAESGEEGL